MSKSKGNVAYPEPIVKVLGNDALRYYLLRDTVFGQDGNFSRDALLTRYNSDLANGLGNLTSRTLTMVANYCGGEIPALDPKLVREHGLYDPNIEAIWKERVASVCGQYDKFQCSGAAESIWSLIAERDQFLTLLKPWARAQDPEQIDLVRSILYVALEVVRLVSVLAHPIIPEGTQKVWTELGQEGVLGNVRIDQLKWVELNPGTKLGKPEAVFPRVDKEEASERIEAMEQEIRNPASAPAAAASAAAPQASAKISIEDFAKVEMRVGVVKSAERVAGADKLLKVLVDIGDEVRQVVAGIAEVYKPEDLIGKKVVVVANLAPRKLRGVESNGMIVAASVAPEGRPVLCTFTEDVPAGTRLK
jgi:methionyl-tRNA synthetase